MAVLRAARGPPHHRRPLARDTRPRCGPDPQLPSAEGNLQGLYGSGPVGSPYLYAEDDPAKLLLSPEGSNVPASHDGIALIGTPRNDVHLFASQMAVAFIKLRNQRTACARTGRLALLEEARRAATGTTST